MRSCLFTPSRKSYLTTLHWNSELSEVRERSLPNDTNTPVSSGVMTFLELVCEPHATQMGIRTILTSVHF